MEKISQLELNSRILKHERWLTNPNIGEQLVLTNMDLQGLRFSTADLSKCEITYCTLTHTLFDQLTLVDAVLHSNDFSTAHFYGCDFSNANLSMCIFKQSAITKSLFMCTRIESALFHDTVVDHSRFNGANFEYTEFICTKFDTCDFTASLLNNTKFDTPIFKDVDFTRAEITNIEGLDMYRFDNSYATSTHMVYIPLIDTVFTDDFIGPSQEFFTYCLKALEHAEDGEALCLRLALVLVEGIAAEYVIKREQTHSH